MNSENNNNFDEENNTSLDINNVNVDNQTDLSSKESQNQLFNQIDSIKDIEEFLPKLNVFKRRLIKTLDNEYEFNYLSVPINKMLVIPECKGEFYLQNAHEFSKAASLLVLHKIMKDELNLSDLASYLEISDGLLKNIEQRLLRGKYKPGQTKKGFGPFYIINLFEDIFPKEHDYLNKLFKTIFAISSLKPFISIAGLEPVALVVDEEERVVTKSKLLEVCQAASILNKFCLIINLLEKCPISAGFFHSAEWRMHAESFKNRLRVEIDALEAFSDNVELASVLLVANQLGVRNRFMLANEHLWNTPESELIISTQQFYELGIIEIKALSTLIGKYMRSEEIMYGIRSVLDPIVNSELLRMTPLKIVDQVIYSYKDYEVNKAIRGAIIAKTEYVNRPIIAFRELDATSGWYSYSTEQIDSIGKTYTDSLNELVKVCDLANFDSIVERLDFAIKGYYTNLTNSELRTLILIKRPELVKVAVPTVLRTMDIDVLSLEELEKISFVYQRSFDDRDLEFSFETGFKYINEAVFVDPFLTALTSIHNESDKIKKIEGERPKSYFPKLMYQKRYLSGFGSEAIVNAPAETIFKVSADDYTLQFSINARSILGLNKNGVYKLKCNEHIDKLEANEPCFRDIRAILKASYQYYYRTIDRVTEHENDQLFHRICKIMNSSLLFKRLGDKIYRHLLQDIINVDGLVNANINALTIHSVTNQGVIEVTNYLLRYITQREDIRVPETITKCNQFKFMLITGGNYENVVG